MTPSSARFFAILSLLAALWSFPGLGGAEDAGDLVLLIGKVVDGRGDSGGLLPCRLYIRSSEGACFTCESVENDGSAVSCEKGDGSSNVECYTCLSAHPFQARLPPGRYHLTAERGHEYLPATAEVILEKGRSSEVTLELHRWIDMAERGWFSGDTHCHRAPAELATVLPAEDLHVAFPLISRLTGTAHTPTKNRKAGEAPPKAELVQVDDNHVYWPVNTECEMNRIDGKENRLGAFHVLNHQELLAIAAPAVLPVAKAVREQGGLIQIDMHSWPWSMMSPKAMRADLFRLANNQHWGNEFAFAGGRADSLPGFMQIPLKGPDRQIDERGWLEFGFRTWYALLNTGLRMMPSAGSASGVPPAPLGFARVYARLGDRGFDYRQWIRAVKEGRTFVTTGPMLFVVVGEKHPGAVIDWDQHLETVRMARHDGAGPEKETKQSVGMEEGTEDRGKETESRAAANSGSLTVLCRVESLFPIQKLEILVNGNPRELEIGGPIGARAPHSCLARAEVEIERSSWIASRVFTGTPEGRLRFAHSAPVWVEVKDKPLVPEILETDYLRKRVETEIERNREALSKDAIEESEESLRFFEEKLEDAIEAHKRSGKWAEDDPSRR